MKEKIDLSVEIAGVKLKNPVIAASGTFGYGDEITDLIDVSKLGAVVTKTITLEPRSGNPVPRLAETASGLLNTIGLQNVGVQKFLKEKWEDLRKLGVPVVVSIAGETAQEYVEVVKILEEVVGIAAIELNLSCPNVSKRIICKDSSLVEEIISQISRISKVPIIAKLSAQVDDLVYLSVLAEKSGAKALSLVNTFPGMAIDVKSWKPKLSTVTGGLSGPAIKPLALKCVWEVFGKVNIPIIGGGGISTAEDALEFFLAGANAVSVGTANFIDPMNPIKILNGLEEYFKSRKILKMQEIVGKLKVEE
ncbi:MAG: dihydroorotate dehydrogenase [Elusimicrobia bacterium]|nr:dihydroorotate dehydrogenase [Elusimicrobiota bacterium]